MKNKKYIDICLFEVSKLEDPLFNIKVYFAYIIPIIQISRNAHVVFPTVQSNPPNLSPLGGKHSPHMKNPKESGQQRICAPQNLHIFIKIPQKTLIF